MTNAPAVLTALFLWLWLVPDPGPAAPESRHQEPVLEAYQTVLSRLKQRAQPASPRAVPFRFGHLFDETAPPDILFTDIKEVDGELVVFLIFDGKEKPYKRGDFFQGAQIVEIAPRHITYEYRGNRGNVTPHQPPWPAIDCRRIEQQDGVWTAFIRLGGVERPYREGDDVAHAKLVEITPERIACEYLGVRRLSTPPVQVQVPCKVTQETAQGRVVFIDLKDGLRPFRVGETVMGGRIAEVGEDYAEIEFAGDKKRFPALPYPRLRCTGTVIMGSIREAHFEGENQGVKEGASVQGATIQTVFPDMVRLNFQGVVQDLPVTLPSHRR